MAIYNMGSGGTNFTYQIKFQETEPNYSNSINTIWIKDSLDFLNPYSSEYSQEQPLQKFVAYKNAMAETAANLTGAFFASELKDSTNKYLHLSSKYGAGSGIQFTLNSTKPYIKVQIPAKSGINDEKVDNYIYIAYSNETASEGIILEKIEKIKYSYSTAVQNVETQHDNSNYNYKYMYVFFDADTFHPTKYSAFNLLCYSDSNWGGTPTTIKGSKGTTLNGQLVDNCVLADIYDTVESYYFETEENKAYKLYTNNNLSGQPFEITSAGFNNSIIPSEGNKGRIISQTSKGIYYNDSGTERYYLIPGSLYKNICFTCEKKLNNKPYIVEATQVYDIHHNYYSLSENGEKKRKISDFYNEVGYTISDLEPPNLQLPSSTDNKRDIRFWLISGENPETHFESVRSRKKKQYLSIEGVTAYLPYIKDGEEKHNILYFLHGSIRLAGTNEWIPLKESVDSFFDLESLLEGTLEDIYYSENETLRDYAFYNYTNLKSCTFPHCYSIGTSTFYNCANLTTVNLPEWNEEPPLTFFTGGKTANDTSPFYGCTNIKNATIGWKSFANGSIGSGKQIAATSPFFSASNILEYIDLPNCKTIGSCTFAYYNGLKSVKLSPDKSVSIRDSAFYNCANLTNIINDSSIKAIGKLAFSKCLSLSSIDLVNVYSIGEGAFSGCTNLKSIASDTMSSCKTISINAFMNTAITKIDAPECSIFGTMNSTNSFSGYTLAKTPIAGCGKTLSQIILGISNGSSPLPAGVFNGSNKSDVSTHLNLLNYISFSQVSSIGPGAFSYLSYLSNITLSPSLTALPTSAFQNCATIIQEKTELEEFDYKIFEFQFNNLKYGYSSNGLTYPALIPKYQKVGEEGNYSYVPIEGEKGQEKVQIGSQAYWPAKDIEGNNIYEEKSNDDGSPYYILKYDENNPMINYDSIKYQDKDYTEIIRSETQGSETIYYGKNKRLDLPEDIKNDYEAGIGYSEFDDWIYKYNSDTNDCTFNECYYRQKTTDDGVPCFKQKIIEHQYISEDENLLNYTLYTKLNDNEEVFDKIETAEGIFIEQSMTPQNDPVYIFNKNNLTIEKHKTNEEEGIQTYIQQESGDYIESDKIYINNPDNDYYYVYEVQKNKYTTITINENNYIIQEYDFDKPIYELINLIPKTENDYEAPLIQEAIYDNIHAISRLVDEFNKPKVDSNFQLQYEAIDHIYGLKTVNKGYLLSLTGNLSIPFGAKMEGLITVGDNAFQNCLNLTEVYAIYGNPIDGTSYPLGKTAFNNCTNLEIVDMPYCTQITNSAASNGFPTVGCSNLKSLNLSNAVFNTASAKNKITNQFCNYNTKTSSPEVPRYPLLNDIKLNNILSIASYAFYGYTNLNNALFNNCLNLSNNAFGSTAFGFITQQELKTVIKKESRNKGNGFYDVWEVNENLLNYISNNAEKIQNIGQCSNILQIPKVTFTGEEVGIFANCSKLMGGIFGKGMTIIPKEAFSGCISLTKISQNSIDINDTGVEYNCLYIPSVSIIGEGAFHDCGAVQNLIVSGSQSTIYTGLSQISFGDVLTEIHSSAFQNCHNLQTVIFNKDTSNPISIGNNAFNNCINLTQVKDIPTQLSYIGENAFTNLDNARNGTLKLYFTNFSVEDTVPSIATNAFPLRNLMIYFSSNDIKNKFITATNWNSYSSFMYVLSNSSTET